LLVRGFSKPNLAPEMGRDHPSPTGDTLHRSTNLGYFRFVLFDRPTKVYNPEYRDVNQIIKYRGFISMLIYRTRTLRLQGLRE
jgi:hypothetical protein